MALADKVAFVTGAARGIGKAICEALLTEKAKICITDILELEGNATLKELGENFGKENVIFYKLNVADENEFEDVVIKAKSHFGHLDILCNNAGCTDEAEPKTIVEVNLLGCINGIQVSFKHLSNSKGEKGGTVINIASTLGLEPLFTVPVYSATKAAIVSLTATWGHEQNVKMTKVKVNSVCPGATDTPMQTSNKSVLHKEYSDKITKSFGDSILRPSAVAKGVLQLLQDDVSGQLLVVSRFKGVYYHTMAVKDYCDELKM